MKDGLQSVELAGMKTSKNSIAVVQPWQHDSRDCTTMCNWWDTLQTVFEMWRHVLGPLRIHVPCDGRWSDWTATEKWLIGQLTCIAGCSLSRIYEFTRLASLTVFHTVWDPVPQKILASCRMRFLWLPCIADADIIFLPCGFYLSSVFFSSPNLSGRRLDVYHTCTHDVALVRVRMHVWNVLHVAHWKYKTQKNSPSQHHRTTLSGHIFATKACIDNRKKTC